jgi:hypothetical protein
VYVYVCVCVCVCLWGGYNFIRRQRRICTVEWWHDRLIGQYFEGFSGGLIGVLSGYLDLEIKESIKLLVAIVSVPSKIRTDTTRIISLGRYSYSKLFILLLCQCDIIR